LFVFHKFFFKKQNGWTEQRFADGMVCSPWSAVTQISAAVDKSANGSRQLFIFNSC